MREKIILVTFNRSDYGILKNLIKSLKKNKKIDFRLVVSGAHLSRKFGNTVDEIIGDKIEIYKKILINIDAQDEINLNSAISSGIIKFSNFFSKEKPDKVIILGDRYELLTILVPAIIYKMKIIHFHGGEKTIGAIDEKIRNCITQVSSLHITCHHNYKNRVIKMVGTNKNIYNFGSLALENITREKYLSKSDLSKKFNVSFNKYNFFVTFHPPTQDLDYKDSFIKNLLNLMKSFDNINFFISYPASDPGSKNIIENIEKYCIKNENLFLIKSTGHLFYHNFLKYVDGIIGNSSSGIIEAPSFKIATINIGKRQHGRIQANNILNSNYNIKTIEKLIHKSISASFKNKIKNLKNPYQKKNTLYNSIQKIINF